MAECEFMETCPFFNSPEGDDETVASMKEKYCKTNNLNCARYMVALAHSPEAAPDDLAPNEKDKAYEIISSS